MFLQEAKQRGVERPRHVPCCRGPSAYGLFSERTVPWPRRHVRQTALFDLPIEKTTYPVGGTDSFSPFESSSSFESSSMDAFCGLVSISCKMFTIKSFQNRSASG